MLINQHLFAFCVQKLALAIWVHMFVSISLLWLNISILFEYCWHKSALCDHMLVFCAHKLALYQHFVGRNQHYKSNVGAQCALIIILWLNISIFRILWAEFSTLWPHLFCADKLAFFYKINSHSVVGRNQYNIISILVHKFGIICILWFNISIYLYFLG